jgi:predicted DsbA family dithiol-disulfide isomerase
MCRIACYKAKFGEEKMKKISAVLKERGKRVGIDFHMAGKTRQTTNAHRLALKALLIGGEQAQTRMVDALFAAFFENEGDIGCYDFLSNAAQSTGLMTAETAKAFLSTDELRDHVNCLIRHSVLQSIKGVPFTIVANQWAIQGAETADSFYRAFNFAANAAESGAQSINFAPQYGHPATNTLVTPEGLAGNAPACTKTIGTAESDAGSVVDETSTTSGTSAATTPNASQSTFSDGRTPVAV